MIKPIPYKVLVYIAYSFYILLGLVQFAMNFLSTGRFDYVSFTIVAVFSVQAYFHHRLTDLILGILTLFLSIIFLLNTISAARHNPSDALFIVDIGVWVLSIIMSGILIFSYLKLNFKD